MLDLSEIRKDIDRIDDQIVKLFEERMELCENVAEYKIHTGKAVLDRSRELEKLEKLTAGADNSFMAGGIREVFQQIMAVSRKRQYQMLTEHGIQTNQSNTWMDEIPREGKTVVFQGVPGAYSHGAVMAYFGKDTETFSVESFEDAMIAIQERSADYAVLPIENSTAGSVEDNYDLLVKYQNHIVGEIILPIQHCLLGIRGAVKEQIRTVYSHPQGLMQCRNYLRQYSGWKLESFSNTAAAAKKIARDHDATQAAIASRYAAEYFDLDILEEQIADVGMNATRFLIIAKEECYVKHAGKISICFELPHEAGTLYNILSHIMYNELNMTKIESRPIPDRAWEYRFFVDFEGNLADPAVINALRGIEQEAGGLRILGNY